MTLTATLYTRPDCHLCEDAEAALRRLGRRYPHHLLTVDITGDPALFERFRYRIPVLAVGDREFDAPLTPAVLVRALAERGQ